MLFQVQRLLLRQKFIHTMKSRLETSKVGGSPGSRHWDAESSYLSMEPPLRVVFKRIFVNDVDEIRQHNDVTMTNFSLYRAPADVSPDEGSLDTLWADDPRLICLTDELVRVLPPKPFIQQWANRTNTEVGEAAPIDNPGSVSSGNELPSNPSVTADDTSTNQENDKLLLRCSSIQTLSSGTKYTPMQTYLKDRALEKRALICRETCNREIEIRFHTYFRRRKDFIDRDVLGMCTKTCQVCHDCDFNLI